MHKKILCQTERQLSDMLSFQKNVGNNIYPTTSTQQCIKKSIQGDVMDNQRTNGPVNAHLISWPSKAQNIQNLEYIW